MLSEKNKTILIHILAWLALMGYHLITGLLLQESFQSSILRILGYHLVIYIPIFYFVYFIVLKPFEKHKNIIILFLSVVMSFAVYILSTFFFTRYAYPLLDLSLNYNYKELKLNWAFVLDSSDYFFLYYFLYALLYWYAQRNIRSQKTLREKEAQAFKTKLQMQELEGMALRAQMNPHFIFNSLNSVQYFIVDKDMATANRYLGRFGHLIRQTLDLAAQSMVSLEQEREYLNTYLELEQMRTPGHFNYSISIAEELDTSHLFLPSMLLQPYVENAVKHGMMQQADGNGKIAIAIKKETGYLVCTVTDNGVGRAATRLLKQPGTQQYQSKGMNITEERIALLNQNQGADIKYQVIDCTDETGKPSGTQIEIRFPLTFVQNRHTH
jgi:sensor histidine kinase YesM